MSEPWIMPQSTIDLPHVPLPRSVEERCVAAGRRGVGVVTRQSTARQAEMHPGSQLAQVQFALEELDRMRIPRAWITLIAAWGETGTRQGPRPRFEELLALVESDRIGLIVVHYGDRTGRNLTDEGRLLDAAAKHAVLFLVNGDLLDPRRARDRRSLASDAVHAEYDNNLRTERFAGAKLMLARDLALRMPLPMGLVWASPFDAVYADAMRRAKLQHWLTRTPDHRVRSTHHATTLYILPWPDAELVASLEVRIRWLFETRSARDVLARIEAGYEGWPSKRTGQLPTLRASAFYDPAIPVVWAPATLDRLTHSLDRRAYYGIYSCYSSLLASTETVARRRRRTKRGVAYGRAINRARPPLPSGMDLIMGHDDGRPRVE